MNKFYLCFLCMSLLFSCRSTYLMISDDENFDSLSQITDSENPVTYSNGGDLAENLVFQIQDRDGYSNLWMKNDVLLKSMIQKTAGSNYNYTPNYNSATNRIAYSHYDKTNFDIYFIDVENSKFRTQVTSSDDDEIHPSWSPDGNLLAFEKGALPKTYISFKQKNKKITNSRFVQLTTNQIWLKDLKTKELKMLGVGSQPKISPDGKSIVFVKYDLSKNRLYNIGTLWVMNIDGDNERQLTDINLGNITNPNWSPNGKNIVFQLRKKNQNNDDIYTIDITAETLKQYTFNKSNDFSPYWSLDNQIYFCSDRGYKAKRYQIWRFKVQP